MGSFSSGTEGRDYVYTYCLNCKNYRDLKDGRGFGCPIWDLHFLHNNVTQWETVLHYFIPYKDCQNLQCIMFLKEEN